MFSAALLAAAFAAASFVAAAAECVVSGTVDIAATDGFASAPLIVALIRLNASSSSSLSDETLLGGAPFAARTVLSDFRDCKTAAGTHRICFDFAFRIASSSAPFAVIAGSDALRDGRFHPELHAPFGFCRAADDWGAYGSVRCGESCEFSADAPVPWPSAVPANAAHGRLWDTASGVHVLHTWGTAKERGTAHGTLLGAQVVDFFRFFVLVRAGPRSAAEYESVVLPYLQHSMHVPAEMLEEIAGIIEGAKAAGAALFVPELSRDLSIWDVVAINAYLELSFPVEHPPSSAHRFGCSQVSFWGSWTAGAGVFAARNMDGEIDPWKVTAQYTLLHATSPSVGRRVVSLMWPGFVGTLSGMSEDGRYLMMDSSSLAQNQSHREAGATVLTWALIETLRSIPADAARTAESTKLWLLKTFGTDAGGLALAGSLLFFASNATSPFVFENNRFGGKLRFADDVPPFEPDCIEISNHFLLYGASGESNFGQPVSFSSLWRYEVWKNKIDAWRDAAQTVTISHMQELLQATCHGTTEHSVVWTPSTISIAVAKTTWSRWHAPYGQWTTMAFEDLFSV